jgi:acyl-CoA synthetase (AMP-forming)/AMP-acid ligase II
MPNLPTTNIASFLPALAAVKPYQPAVVFPHARDRAGRVAYTHFTIRQLDDESNRLAHGLQQVGIRQGVRTVLMVKPGLEFFALVFALFKVGAVPVLIDPGMGVRNLGQCLAEAQPQAFIGIPKAQLARRLLGWGRKTIHVVVTVGRRPFWGGFSLEDIRQRGENAGLYPPAAFDAHEPAAILFTSGSTGPPKGAVYTHSVFLAQVELLRDTFGIEPGEIDLCTFPLFALFAPALAMTAVVPDMDATRPALANPGKIIEAIEDFGVTNLFGSPALLNRLSLHGEEHGTRLPTLRRVISAGAPVSATIVDRMSRMLAPGVQVFTPYGATEALPVSNIGSDEILQETRHETARGAGICVGKPVHGMEVLILRISDEPIPCLGQEDIATAGEIGEIAVKGLVVTATYFNRPEATTLAKTADPSGGLYHRMGDLGYLDAAGRLWMCGRKSHRVQTSGKTLFTIPCEGVFNVQPDVYRTALVGVGAAGAAQPVLCVELKPECRGANREQVRRELLTLGAAHPHTSGIRSILFHPAFPVDIRHNSKIFREKLALWAAKVRT